MWKGNVRRGIGLACAALLALGACVAPLEQTPPETISEPGLTGGSVRKTARFCSCVIYLPDYSTREDHHAGTLDSPGT